jgi:hypothetical protein
LLGVHFETYESFISLFFFLPPFSGRIKAQITESADMGARLFCSASLLLALDMKEMDTEGA